MLQKSSKAYIKLKRKLNKKVKPKIEIKEYSLNNNYNKKISKRLIQNNKKVSMVLKSNNHKN